MFEAFAIEALLACGNVKSADSPAESWNSCNTLGWNSCNTLGSTRGVSAVVTTTSPILTDLRGHRVLEVVEDRMEAAADQLWEGLTNDHREQIEAVAVDRWPAFADSVETNAPRAEIMRDRFHISKHLNEGIDKVRRQEHKALLKNKDERLKGTKQSWLFNPEHMSEDRWIEFDALKDQELKTLRAWAIKE